MTFTGPVEVAPGSTPLNLVFDGDTWGNVGHAAHEGRLSIVGGGSASAQRGPGQNSTFGPGGCSDGIQDSSSGTEIGPNNEFKGIVQGGCSEHADAIQPYASNYVYIHDNYLHDNEQGIMSPDGVSHGLPDHQQRDPHLDGLSVHAPGRHALGNVTHNVCRNGQIRVYGGNQNQASQNMVVRDNAAGIDASACSGCTIDHNQTVSYTGGSGRCAYATASPKGTASDGTDIGLNSCGATSPAAPAAAVGHHARPTRRSPRAPRARRPTTRRRSPSPRPRRTRSSSAASTPASWADCTSPWTTAALGDGAHSVSVRATDVAGNTDASPATRSFTVGTAPPPDTTAPDTTITSGPTGTTTDNTPTFAFTATEANSVFECRVDSGRVGRLHQPVDDRGPRRRRTTRSPSAPPTWRATPTPRPRPARSPSTRPRRRRRTRRPPTRRSARARPARRRPRPRRSRSPRASPARPSSASSIPAPGRPARARSPTAA